MAVKREKMNGPDVTRRAMLTRLGLAATAIYATPVLLHLSQARASGGSGGGGSGGGGSGGGGSGGGDSGGGDSGASAASAPSAPSAASGPSADLTLVVPQDR